MKYYRNISNGYIVSVSTGAGQIEISENEYNEILNVINNVPTAPQGYEHKLKEDLTWELCEMPAINEITEEHQEAVI